jgi:hypothetical protein
MKLNELIKSNHWLSVEHTLLKLYPDQKKMLSEYKEVFEKLKKIEPKKYKELEIVFTEYDSESDTENFNETYIDVSGRKKNTDPNLNSDSYALEFLEWDKWLGMEIANETIKKFSELEIITHCLFEMTFVDYDDEAIQLQFKLLNATVEKYKNLPEIEKKQKTISLDEFKQKLDLMKGSE